MELLDIDLIHNRIHVTLSGTFNESQAQTLLSEVESRLAELKKGFLVLCDLSSLRSFDRAARVHFRRIMDLCNDNGVGKIIRIVPKAHNDFGLTIMSCFHYDNDVPVITCETLEEASRFLHKK